MNSKKYAVLAFSGGMDSATLLLNLLADGYNVTAVSFNYGQKHILELRKAKELVQYMNDNQSNWPVDPVEMYHKVNHHIITIIGLSPLLSSTLVEGGAEVPEGHYEQENMKDTVVPNRNKIFSSIIQAIALSIANKNNTDCVIAMGIHAGDHAIYPDCRKEFRDVDYAAFLMGNWDAEKVTLFTPYLENTKYDILKSGVESCEQLGLDFDEVYRRTNTSYKPISIISEDGQTYADYSDYKSASSIERIEAFIKLGRHDPIQYADENGLVPWEIVEKHAKNVLNIPG